MDEFDMILFDWISKRVKQSEPEDYITAMHLFGRFQYETEINIPHKKFLKSVKRLFPELLKSGRKQAIYVYKGISFRD